MPRLFQPFLLMLATATDHELARQMPFLKVENQMLRSWLPKRIKVTLAERRRLLRYGKPLGSAIRHLITIVSPRTFSRWLIDAKRKRPPNKVGRPRLQPIRDLVVLIASQTGWGFSRVLGEIKKLTSRKVSRQFVVNVMREHGFDPGPKRGEKTWHEFVTMHADSLWQCDFFSKQVITLTGIREFFILAFIHVGTRRVFVLPATTNPTEAWCQTQVPVFLEHAKRIGVPVEYVFRDRDSKFGRAFDAELARHGVKGQPVPYRAPNMNAFIERWIQSIELEMLDHFIVFGERHLNHLVQVYVDFYLTHRPHQGVGNVLLSETPEPEEDVPPTASVRCQKFLGGHLKHFYRKAA